MPPSPPGRRDDERGGAAATALPPPPPTLATTRLGASRARGSAPARCSGAQVALVGTAAAAALHGLSTFRSGHARSARPAAPRGCPRVCSRAARVLRSSRGRAREHLRCGPAEPRCAATCRARREIASEAPVACSRAGQRVLTAGGRSRRFSTASGPRARRRRPASSSSASWPSARADPRRAIASKPVQPGAPLLGAVAAARVVGAEDHVLDAVPASVLERGKGAGIEVSARRWRSSSGRKAVLLPRRPGGLSRPSGRER